MDSSILTDTQAFITKQRDALLQQRESIFSQQQELQQQLDAVNAMLAKFDVFALATLSQSKRGRKLAELAAQHDTEMNAMHLLPRVPLACAVAAQAHRQRQIDKRLGQPRGNRSRFTIRSVSISSIECRPSPFSGGLPSSAQTAARAPVVAWAGPSAMSDHGVAAEPGTLKPRNSKRQSPYIRVESNPLEFYYYTRKLFIAISSFEKYVLLTHLHGLAKTFSDCLQRPVVRPYV
jgi:hypothetical protein